MPKSSLENKLKENGCDVPIKEFQDTLESIFMEQYVDFSIDSLLLNPSEAIDFCERIKGLRDDYNTLPDELILRCLLARRKNPA